MALVGVLQLEQKLEIDPLYFFLSCKLIGVTSGASKSQE